MDFLNQFSIDSCKIRLPIDMISIKDNRLYDDYISVHKDNLLKHGSIEIDETDFKRKAIKVEENGVKIHFLLQNFFIDAKGSQRQFLVMLINSKILGSDYFKGINSETIRQVYDAIQSLGIVSFNYESFIWNAKVSDLDIKVDFLQKKPDAFFSKIVSDCDKNKRSSFSNKGYKRFKSKTNKGIAFGSRPDATLGSPFFKLYHKKTELFYNSNVFFAKYLQKFFGSKEGNEIVQSDYNYIVRAEYTLKNQKFIKKFLNCDGSLEFILKVTQEQYRKAIQEIKLIHIAPREIKKVLVSLSPMDQMLLNSLLLWHSIEPNVHYAEVKNVMLEGLTGNAKARAKKKLEQLYYSYIIEGYEDEIVTEQKHIQKGLEIIGYIL